MAVTDVKKIYQEIIEDVCKGAREALSEEGFDDHTLQELRSLWRTKLENSSAVQPVITSAVDRATTREFRHPGTGETSFETKQATGMRINHFHPSSSTAVSTYNTVHEAATSFNAGLLSMTNQNAIQYARPNFPVNATIITSNTMKTSNQLDGTNDEVIVAKNTKKTNCRKKKSKFVEVSLQLDGTGPPVGDDEDDDNESELENNDVGDDLDDDDDDDDGNEEGKEDPHPLCSDDDVSDDEPNELFDADNVVVCQYDKISRTKNKWRFTLKSGIMNVAGRDYVFSKATGEADW